MVIIIPPNPAATLREQHLRLWKRNRSRAVWTAGSVVSLAVLTTTLLLGGLVLAAYLANYGISERAPLWVVIGVLAGFGGPLAAHKLWRTARPFFLGIVTDLVAGELQRDHDDRAGVTKLEREVLEPLYASFEDVEKLAAQARDTAQPEPMALARERWQKAYGRPSFITGRVLLPKRFLALELVLSEGAQASTSDVSVYAETALIVAAEAREGLNRLLSGRPQDTGGFVWPEYWPSMRDVHDLRARLAERREVGG